MADVSQVETSFAFEPRITPSNPAPATERDRPSQTSIDGREDAAFSVDISADAQQISASGNSTPQPPAVDDAGGQTPDAGTSARFDTTFETSAPDGVEGATGDAGSRTNQVASFEGERTGNDTRNTTEAGRTLGQVVDTFA